MATKIYCVSYADHRMTISQKKLESSFLAVPHMAGVERFTMGFNPPDLDPVFYERNKKILDQERGAGYWLWKPYVIHRALVRVDHNDWVIYCDAGIEITRDISFLFNTTDDMVFFCNKWPHIDWCKTSVIRNMLGYWWDPTYKQNQASICLFRKNPLTVAFVSHWLSCCQWPGFIDDSPGDEDNPPSFREHRHDQAILTNLCIQYKIKRHWWKPVYNDEPHESIFQDNWPEFFNHHRKRNDEW